MRLQVCTLVSTNMILGRMDFAFQQVLTMLQQGPVRQRSLSLSMHSQVEPVGFNSQTTRVGHHPRVWVHTNGYHSQVVANTATSIVTFSILSPDASLSYDRIKLRLEEYRTLLASDSDTIELSTENGRTVICQKQANEMEEYLDRAELLLLGVVQSRDISTLVVLHHLCDLTKVLDKLKLYDECRMTGNCALDLAEALGRRSLEFRQEQAETLALIADLSVYQPRARTLFIRAVSIYEGVVANNASHSNKHGFLIVLGRAGLWASGDLSVQWLGHAIQLMTELPPSMVDPDLRSVIYSNYGSRLYELKQYASSLEAFDEAISIHRILATNNPARYNPHLARTLSNKGVALTSLGRYDYAIVVHTEAVQIISAQDPLQSNELMAKTLYNYGSTLGQSNQFSEAAAVEKQAVSLYRNLAQTGHEYTKLLCDALQNYGSTCHSLGKQSESVHAYQESIFLLRALAATDFEEISLIRSLHNIAQPLLALGRRAEANAAANEALERGHQKVLEFCNYAPDFESCFVCQRAISPASPPVSFLLSSQPAEHPGADASLTPLVVQVMETMTEHPELLGESLRVCVYHTDHSPFRPLSIHARVYQIPGPSQAPCSTCLPSPDRAVVLHHHGCPPTCHLGLGENHVLPRYLSRSSRPPLPLRSPPKSLPHPQGQTLSPPH